MLSEWIKDNKKGLVLLAGYIVNVACANLINLVQPNKTQSDKYYTLITPPGWAFAIWGVIYMSQAVSVILTLVPKTKEFALQIVDWPFVGMYCALCFCQSLWAVVFWYSVNVSSVVLALAFVSLAALQTYTIRKFESPALTESLSGWRRYAAFAGWVFPYSLNCGWVTAAAGLNVSLVQVARGASAEAQVSTAVCTILWCFGVSWTLGVFGSPLARYGSDPALTGGIVWALYAVAKHQSKRPENAVDGVITFPPDSLVPGMLSTVSNIAASVLLACQVARCAINVIKPRFFPEKAADSDVPLSTKDTVATMES